MSRHTWLLAGKPHQSPRVQAESSATIRAAEMYVQKEATVQNVPKDEAEHKGLYSDLRVVEEGLSVSDLVHGTVHN